MRSKAATNSGNLQQALEAQQEAHDKVIQTLNAALATEKAAASQVSTDSEHNARKHNDEITTLKKALEESDDAFITAQEKANEALEARGLEVDGLNNVVKALQGEIEKLASDEQQDLQDKIAELNSQHEALIKEAHEKAEKIAQEANKKIESITKEHQAQLEAGSGALVAQLHKAKAAAEAREEELLEKIEAGKKESAKAIEAAQESAADSIKAIKKESEALEKEFEEKLEEFQKQAIGGVEKDKEWESKIEQLKGLHEEQVNALTTKLDSSQKEIERLLQNIEAINQEANENLKAAVEKGDTETSVLKKTLDALNSDLTVCLSNM